MVEDQGSRILLPRGVELVRSEFEDRTWQAFWFDGRSGAVGCRGGQPTADNSRGRASGQVQSTSPAAASTKACWNHSTTRPITSQGTNEKFGDVGADSSL